jgi:hypothetical protein
MRALVLRDYYDIAVEERPDPVAGPGQVVVEVIATGICGSDLHGYSGENGRRHPWPDHGTRNRRPDSGARNRRGRTNGRPARDRQPGDVLPRLPGLPGWSGTPVQSACGPRRRPRDPGCLRRPGCGPGSEHRAAAGRHAGRARRPGGADGRGLPRRPPRPACPQRSGAGHRRRADRGRRASSPPSGLASKRCHCPTSALHAASSVLDSVRRWSIRPAAIWLTPWPPSSVGRRL